MSDAILALRLAVQAHLEADPALAALIGTGRIHDEPPRAAKGVYLVHGEVEADDWSTGSDAGCEQRLGLVVWADESASSRQALEAAAAIVASLSGAQLSLEGHRLINLTWLSSRLARDPKSQLPMVALRFRAVTETL
ncbi:DUF3168 domain-containing protein [Bosea sp. (in: a-proteobacteria)]|uniref:DUF3168 domain-containing protein n=1 Tax=Bosea sp. (in: a-proteobacteria) TaxID=1871050 RepID=UPI002FCB9BFF